MAKTLRTQVVLCAVLWGMAGCTWEGASMSAEHAVVALRIGEHTNAGASRWRVAPNALVSLTQAPQWVPESWLNAAHRSLSAHYSSYCRTACDNAQYWLDVVWPELTPSHTNRWLRPSVQQLYHLPRLRNVSHLPVHIRGRDGAQIMSVILELRPAAYDFTFATQDIDAALIEAGFVDLALRLEGR